MHFKILKTIAASDFLTALECTKFFFGWGSAPDSLRDLTALSKPRSCFKEALLVRGEKIGKGGAR